MMSKTISGGRLHRQGGRQMAQYVPRSRARAGGASAGDPTSTGRAPWVRGPTVREGRSRLRSGRLAPHLPARRPRLGGRRTRLVVHRRAARDMTVLEIGTASHARDTGSARRRACPRRAARPRAAHWARSARIRSPSRMTIELVDARPAAWSGRPPECREARPGRARSTSRRRPARRCGSRACRPGTRGRRRSPPPARAGRIPRAPGRSEGAGPAGCRSG